MAKRKGIEWQKVNTETLPKEVKTAFDSFTKAYRALEDAREDFNARAKEYMARQKLVPDGKVATFNYTGKVLNIGFVEPTKTSDRNLFSFS